MTRVLCIGCSFTAGYYTMETAVDDGGPIEIPHPELGWWSDLNRDYHYDVYSFFGGGYLNYAHLLDTIDRHEYSAVIIQESWENRLSVYENTDWLPAHHSANTTVNHKTGHKLFVTGMDQKPFIIDRLRPTYNTEFNHTHTRYLADLAKNPYMQTVVNSSAAMTNHLLRDTPVFTFNLHPPTNFEPYTDFTRLPFNFKRFNDLFYTDGHNYHLESDFCGHLTLAGTQEFARIVKQAFDRLAYPPGISLRF